MLLRMEVTLLVILIHVVSTTGAEMAPIMCPAVCKCSDMLLTANCTNADLEQIPADLPSKYRVFVFDNNGVTVINSDALRGLKQVKYLSFSRCNISKIQDGAFDSVRNLTKLDLGGNRLDFVPREIRNLSQLLELDLSFNSIDRLAKNSFLGMKKLQTLTLDSNNITMLAKGGLYDTGNLRVLYLRNNGIHTIKQSSFHCLDNLEELYLNDNSFASLPHAWLVGLFKLRILKLRRAYSAGVSYNMLPSGNVTASGWLFPGLSPLLEVLDLAENGLTSLESNAFIALEELTDLDLSMNQLSEIPLGLFYRQPKLRRLDLSFNLLRNLTEILFPEEAELEYLDLGNNLLETIGEKPFKNLKNLKILGLQRNVLYDISFVVKANLPNLVELNLASNIIANISSVGFTNLVSLEKLILKNNQLKNVPNVRNLTALTVLDLSRNGLSYIPLDAFDGTNLQELDLQNNYINTLDQRTLNDLPRLGAVRVGNNPWKCDCEIQWFGQAAETEQWGRGLKSAMCDWPPSMKDTRVVVQQEEVQCTSALPPTSIIILVVIWIMVLLIISTAILVRTYKIHRIRSRRRPKEETVEEQPESEQPLAPPVANTTAAAAAAAAAAGPDRGKGKGKSKTQKAQIIQMKERKPVNGLKVKPFDREYYV